MDAIKKSVDIVLATQTSSTEQRLGAPESAQAADSVPAVHPKDMKDLVDKIVKTEQDLLALSETMANFRYEVDRSKTEKKRLSREGDLHAPRAGARERTSFTALG